MSARAHRLYVVLAGIFLANLFLAEFIGVKIFALGPSLGLPPGEWTLFGITGSYEFTVGVMMWPVVFILTDVLNEYFGKRGVRFLTWLGTILILYAFAVALVAIRLVPAPWWPGAAADQGVADLQVSYASIFGQGAWSIAGSVTAFLLSQLIDIALFRWFRKRTGEGKIWLRATGSTVISQFFDTFLVLYIAFVLGPQGWSFERLFAVGTVNYGYKVLVAIALTPVLYLLHRWIRAYLGADEARRMANAAAMDAPPEAEGR